MHQNVLTGKHKRIITFLFATFYGAQMINHVFSAVIPSFAGSLMTILYVFCVVAIVLSYIVSKSNFVLKSNPTFFISLFLILIYYCTTKLLADTSLSISYFLIFVVFAFLTPTFIEVDVKALLEYILIIPALFVYWSDAFLSITIKDNIGMSDSYAMLIPSIASIVYATMFWRNQNKKKKILMAIVLIINFYYLIRIFVYGSRGPALSMVLCFLFLVLNKNKRTENTSLRSKTRIVLFVALILFATIFFWQIVSFLLKIMSKLGLSIQTLNKIVKLNQQIGVMNGRDVLYKTAWKGIIQKPLFGHGISTFYSNTGYIYPHSFLIQIAYDGGILLFSALVFPFVSKLWKVLVNNNNNEKLALIALLFFSSVPGALFSGDCWENQKLWVCVGFTMSNNLSSFIGEKYHEIII